MKFRLGALGKAMRADNLSADVPWSRITTLGIGSTAAALAEPEDDIELTSILKFCGQHSVPYLVVGSGSNLVGTDEPFEGIIIRLDKHFFKEIKPGREHMTVGAGVKLRDIAFFCADRGFGGMAPLAPIPGTVGGAIAMNAGADGVSMSDFVVEICGLDGETGIWKATEDQVGWKYRGTSLSKDKIILAAILKMGSEKGDPASMREKVDAALRRRASLRIEGRNAGCVFRNPGQAAAGKLLDRAGCKNSSEGDIAVSASHANYFVNKGCATEKNFVDLIVRTRREVFKQTGIILSPEVRFANEKSRDSVLNSIPKIKVALLKGGTSSEREISLISAKYVAAALRDAGYDLTEIDVREPAVGEEMRKADIVFPMLHGGFGENGDMQKALEEAGIPFVGCGSKASSIAIDKIKSKKIMEQNGIPTAEYAVVHKDKPGLPGNLALPLVIKPPCEGSTVGISIVSTPEEYERAIRESFKFGDEMLVEKYVPGTEITVGILDGKPLPAIEIKYPGKTYDFDAKYTHNSGETKYLCPPQAVTEEKQRQAATISLDFYRAIGARDMLRVDLICGNDGNLYVLEANNIPGFTDSSLLPKAAATAGISFVELCARLVLSAARRAHLAPCRP